VSFAPRRWQPEVHDALASIVRTAPPGALATFDWDNTCMTGDIGEAVLEDLDAADDGERLATYERMCVEQGKHAAYAWCAYQVAPRSPEAARQLADHAFSTRIADGRMRVRPEIVELISAMHAHGWEVWVVSASEERLVRALAPRYGIDPERVIGMRLADDGGVLQPRLDGPNTFRQGKVDAIDQRIGRRPRFAAGDAETDLEMLGAAQHRLFLDKRGDVDDPVRVAVERLGALVQPAASW
jgi:HAD superfamily phosphoserine phosphatase-like hydrolase